MNKSVFRRMSDLSQKHYRIILLILAAVGLFYWFQWRPMIIREQCAMPELYTDPIPALTQNDIDTAIAAYNKCLATNTQPQTSIVPPPASAFLNNPIDNFLNQPYCPITSPNGEEGTHLLTATPHPAIPAKPYFVQATPAEYSACLHIHGI